MSYYLTDGAHVLIAGATGAGDQYGGKSVLANWWFHQSVERGHHDVGVFINPDRHSFVRGATVSSLKGLAESYRSGRRVFDVRTSDPGPVVAMLERLPGTKIVVFDEAWTYQDAPALQRTTRELGNVDEGTFRAIVVSQRAWDLDDGVRGCCPLKIWVGPLTSEGKAYFQAENMRDVIEPVAAAAEPYHWAVTDGGDYVETNPPVPGDYAR